MHDPVFGGVYSICVWCGVCVYGCRRCTSTLYTHRVGHNRASPTLSLSRGSIWILEYGGVQVQSTAGPEKTRARRDSNTYYSEYNSGFHFSLVRGTGAGEEFLKFERNGKSGAGGKEACSIAE